MLLATALMASAVLGLPAAGASADVEPAPSPAQLPALQAELTAAAARAQQLAGQLDDMAGQDVALHVAMDRLAEAHDAAQARLDARVRTVFITATPDPLGDVLTRLRDPALRKVLDRGRSAAVGVDRGLIDALTRRSASVRALEAKATARRLALLAQAGPALAAQDRARSLLAQAQAAASRLAAEAAARAAAALAVQRAALDQASADVTRALTPAQTARGERARSAQVGTLAAVEAAGLNYPAGYAPTGQVLTGTASWYGPGFVGSPTASGAPYDPERLTCANKELPLGTVIRVSANGLATSCLVNDRGPYVGDRILDMSRAGSRALGYDGLAQVTIEVLRPA